jgi:germination protein M
MRKNYWFILMVLLLILSGCSFLGRNGEEPPPLNGDRPPQTASGLRETVFYLPDGARQVLVPVRVGIPWEEGIAKVAVRSLIEGNVPLELQNLGLSPLLPSETVILGLSIRDGLARIDFSAGVLKFDPAHERQIVYGLVYTLSEFPTISKVEILVEGKKAETGNGLMQKGPFDRSAGMSLEVADSVTDVEKALRITLYYLLPLGEQVYYVPVTRVIADNDDVIRATAEELLRGPAPGSPLFTAIPRGISLQDISIEGSKLTLFLAGDFGVSGGQLAADRILRQLALTFTEIPGIAEVELIINGQLPQWPPGVQFPAAFSRPAKWNLVGISQ